MHVRLALRRATEPLEEATPVGCRPVEGRKTTLAAISLFVSSGVVEAGCKSVIGQRLKSSGMRWTVSGADAIIALRCKEASSTWEAICCRPRAQARTA